MKCGKKRKRRKTGKMEIGGSAGIGNGVQKKEKLSGGRGVKDKSRREGGREEGGRKASRQKGVLITGAHRHVSARQAKIGEGKSAKFTIKRT